MYRERIRGRKRRKEGRKGRVGNVTKNVFRDKSL